VHGTGRASGTQGEFPAAILPILRWIPWPADVIILDDALPHFWTAPADRSEWAAPVKIAGFLVLWEMSILGIHLSLLHPHVEIAQPFIKLAFGAMDVAALESAEVHCDLRAVDDESLDAFA